MTYLVDTTFNNTGGIHWKVKNDSTNPALNLDLFEEREEIKRELEAITTQTSQSKKMSYRDVLEKLRTQSREADSRRKEYLKKRGERLSILDHDE